MSTYKPTGEQYTPSTEEVREVWRFHSGYGVEAENDFDRWLAAHLLAARAEVLREFGRYADGIWTTRLPHPGDRARAYADRLEGTVR